MLLLDMVQNDPGDKTVAWQSTKYTDASVLAALNFTGRVTTGELSPFLTVDFHTVVPGGVWNAGSEEAAWVSAMQQSVMRRGKEAKAAGLQFIPFVDMIVFPVALVERYSSQILDDGKIVYNNVTAGLVRTMIEETFEMYGDVIDGVLIRTGETYVFDTPYHTGNSPTATVPSSNQTAVWVQWLDDLRNVICVKNDKMMIQRAWDSFGGWTGDPAVYLAITDPVEPHPKLYFSVKVSAGDFFRYMDWNQQLGVGNHAQIIEVELQREYEAKLATPDYIMPGYIYGFNDLPTGGDSSGIIDVLAKPQVRGLWTWSRGGGWWGPYIHHYEYWVDLHMSVSSCWWNANFGAAKAQSASSPVLRRPGSSARPKEVKTEEDCYNEFVQEQWGLAPGTPEAAALRVIAVNSSEAVKTGHYCPEGPDFSNCWIWTRDDRLGGLQQGLGSHFETMVTSADPDSALNASIAWKDASVATWTAMQGLFVSSGADAALQASGRAPLANYIRVSIEFGLRLYSIVREAFEIFAWGVRHDHGLPTNKTALGTALQRYDAGWAGYAGFGLANEEAPSLYRPVYFNLPGQEPEPGMNATVQIYRPLAV